MPRTFDPLERENHFAHLYDHLSRRAYREQVGRVAQAIRADVIPQRMQDVLYAVITSSLWMGQRRAGAERHCARTCCAARGAQDDTFESVEHAYCDCSDVAWLWDEVLARWRERTGENLQRDHRTALLGDRGEEARAATEEAWRALHAVVIFVIHRTRRAAKGEEGAARQHTRSEMLHAVQRQLTHLAQRRMHWHAMRRTRGGFGDAWVDTGVARIEPDGSMHVLVLDRRPPATAAPETSEGVVPARRVYTDGSFFAKEKDARAGWAHATYAVDADGRTMNFVGGRFGAVQLSQRHKDFRGAGKHSNNSGEMTGLLKAIETETEREGAVTFHVDSLYAIKIARGEWCPSKGKGANNRELARALRLAYRRLWEARPPGHVRIVHERAHVGTRGNEVADVLAKRGTACAEDDGACEREPTPKPSSVVRAGHTANSARPPGDPG